MVSNPAFAIGFKLGGKIVMLTVSVPINPKLSVAFSCNTMTSFDSTEAELIVVIALVGDENVTLMLPES